MFGIEWWGSAPLGRDRRASFFGGAVLGCGVLPTGGPHCAKRDRNWRTAMAHFNPDLTVLWIGAWEAVDFTIHGQRYRHRTPAHRHQIERALQAAVRTFTARGGRVALLEVPCFGTIHTSDENFGSRNDRLAIKEVNDAQRAVASRMPDRVTFVPWSTVCRDGHPVSSVDGVLMRPDGVHVQSEAAAGIVLHELVPTWLRLGRAAVASRGRLRSGWARRNV
jgi:hypothetical protein